MYWTASINIYFGINIDKQAQAALLSTLSVLKFPVIQASCH